MADRLSAELWAQIFFEASVDGGRTACALSEVSRYFRDVMLPFQFDNVALIGYHKITRFAELLRDKQNQTNHFRVRHLFVSYSTWVLLSSSRPLKGAPGASGAALQYVLSTTAPFLLTLTCTVPEGRIGNESLSSFRFPMLRELTIHGEIAGSIHSSATPFPPLNPNFPALQRLHLLTSPQTFYVYTQHAPNLTHVRFSSLGALTVRLFEALRHVSEPVITGTNNSSSIATDDPDSLFKLPPTVEKVLIQMSPSMSAFKHRSPFVNGGPTITAFGELRGRGKLVFLDKPDDLSLPAYLVVSNERKDWEGRIIGALGCWAEPRYVVEIMFECLLLLIHMRRAL